MMLTLAEVASHFQVTPQTVTSWILSGRMTAVNIAKPTAKRRFYRIPVASVTEFERSSTINTAISRIPTTIPCKIRKWV